MPSHSHPQLQYGLLQQLVLGVVALVAAAAQDYSEPCVRADDYWIACVQERQEAAEAEYCPSDYGPSVGTENLPLRSEHGICSDLLEGAPDVAEQLSDINQNFTILLPPEGSLKMLNTARTSGSLNKQQVADVLKTHVIPDVSDSIQRAFLTHIGLHVVNDLPLAELPKNPLLTLGAARLTVTSWTGQKGFYVLPENATAVVPAQPLELLTRGSFSPFRCRYKTCRSVCDARNGSYEIYPVRKLLAPFDLEEYEPFKSTQPLPVQQCPEFFVKHYSTGGQACPATEPICHYDVGYDPTDDVIDGSVFVETGKREFEGPTDAEVVSFPLPAPSSWQEPLRSRGLTGGQITGITWGGVGLLLILTALFVWWVVRSKSREVVEVAQAEAATTTQLEQEIDPFAMEPQQASTAIEMVPAVFPKKLYRVERHLWSVKNRQRPTDVMTVTSLGDRLTSSSTIDSNEQALCTICLDKVADRVLMPCGHGGYCSACMRKICNAPAKRCPVCRCTLSAAVKVPVDTPIGRRARVALSHTCGAAQAPPQQPPQLPAQAGGQ